MRNLKRALSLTLASVMLLGMMVVGTSAASFPDVDDEDNVEAIEVAKAVGVMIGDDRGNFNPNAAVTRNEMAVIMAKLLLGTYEADSYVGTHPFTDVPQWADRYVAACYASGIVAGRSATIYDGTATVTAVEAAAMMLRALGYEDLSKNADRWDQPVAAKANEINLFKGMNGNGNANMNRDSVAKLTLNALESTMVTTSRTTSDIHVGDVIISGAIQYNERKDINTRDYTVNVTDAPDDVTLQLCEYLYDNDLKKNAGDTDNMAHPATTWTYKGEKVTSIADAPDYAGYITGSNNNLTKLVDSFSKKLDETGADIFVNGTETTWTEAVGDYAEIYLAANDVNQIEKIVVTKYNVSKLTGDAATKEVDEDIQVRVPGLTGGSPSLSVYNEGNTTETVHGYEGLVEDDIVLWYQDNEGEYYLELAKSFNGTMTAAAANKYTVNGTKYDRSGATGTMVDSDVKAFNKESATWFTDKGGNIVWVKGEEATEVAYVMAIKSDDEWDSASGTVDSTAKNTAMLLFADGTVETVTYKDASGFTTTADTFVKYTVKDSTYTLSSAGTYNNNVSGNLAATTGDQVEITKGNPTITFDKDAVDNSAFKKTILTNSETIFFVRDCESTNAFTSGVNTKAKNTYTMYTGYAAAPAVAEYTIAAKVADNATTGGGMPATTAVAYMNANGYAKYVVLCAGVVNDTTSATDLFYVVSSTVTTLYEDGSASGYTVRAVKNGGDEIVDLEFATSPSVVAGEAYIATGYNKDGQISSFSSAVVTDTPADAIVGTGTGKANNGTFKLGGAAYGYTNDTVVYYIDKDNKLDIQTVGDLDDNANDTFVAIRGSKVNTEDKYSTIDVVFVREKVLAVSAVYTSGTLTESNITAADAANKIVVGGQDIAVTNTDTIDTLLTKLQAVTALTNVWTIAKDTNDIKFTANQKGALGADGAPTEALATGLTKAIDGVTAVKAVYDSGAVTAANGSSNTDTLTIGGFSVTIDTTQVANQDLGAQLTAWLTATGAEGAGAAATAGWDVEENDNGDGIKFTAKTAGAIGSNGPSSVPGSATEVTKGVDGVEAVYKLTDAAGAITAATTADEQLSVGGHIAPVSGATLADKLTAFVTHYTANATDKTLWTASVSGNEILFTATTPGAIESGHPAYGHIPTGTTLKTAGVTGN